MAEQEKASGDWDQHTVEDAIEDKFGVGCNDISPFGYAPADRIEHPEEPDPTGGDGVYKSNISAQSAGKLSRKPDQVIADEKPAPNPETVIACNGSY